MNVQSEEVDIDVWSYYHYYFICSLFSTFAKKTFFLGHPVTILSGNFAIQIPEKTFSRDFYASFAL